ncbi:aldehyde dehydrogenase [Coccomyxa subellipsoidea C-169]|uniref:Aldehyde dehydrogenase n=1 Tax=Coccomyxa subellipsoidea (strain C-169) TaxID=574566 RepID=I0YJ92_COCSC|nr:aldehyde dehydrogenase [Coccomyxa subellipsoidea C-169]EIE18461.1 aldehyde dehydrogenase [Coccomyxa subellipsoidea C-169]|eukprot:XP_005643005.1 aldehyde dehydrogenase [Coccomyxa subellipsoidea C-169]
MLATTSRRLWSLHPFGQSQRLLSSWASVDPSAISGSNPGQAYNLVNGEWGLPAKSKTIPDPLNGEPFIKLPDTQLDEIDPFVQSLRAVPKSGLHNPLKNPERYNMYGAVIAKAAEEMRKPEVEDYFTKLVQRVAPKHDAQARAEVVVTRRFLENFSGDQVRFTARSFGVAGDHAGQMSTGHRWPYGPVGLITPFNFPLEIPALQLIGAVMMGNKPLVHVDHRVSIVAEAFLRMLHHVGMPMTDADYVHGHGSVVNEILVRARPRSTLFTGSQRVAEKLCADLHGKVFLEDAGFDWKVLGPDVFEPDYIAWQCDQDAYACSGQKCSAQSILFQHSNWVKAGLEEKLAQRAAQRKLDDLSIGPVLTWTTDAMLAHVDKLLKIPGARVAFGGKPLEGHSIPDVYGAIQPTAVFVPLDQILKDENFGLVTTEVFGPFQVLTEYSDEQLPLVLEALEKLEAHLTAAVVSNDPVFTQKVLANTVNGTTYAGIRARTTGAPQNHWFGPAGDPRSAGIGTPEAIRLVWSCHREIISDVGPIPQGFQATTT